MVVIIPPRRYTVRHTEINTSGHSFNTPGKAFKMAPLDIIITPGRYTIHRMDKAQKVPEAVFNSRFYSVTKTGDELSVVCESALAIPSGQSESGWSCLRVRGPLAFSLTGVLADLSGCLARAGISIFALSTHDTDYILVKTEALADATTVLSAAGHTIIRTRSSDVPEKSRPEPAPPLMAATPEPPYYAVIFTSIRTGTDKGYQKTARDMMALAARQPGFLGVESAREDLGLTVSYWSDLGAIRAWKANAEHLAAQKQGKADWYSGYRIRISRVDHEYEFIKTDESGA